MKRIDHTGSRFGSWTAIALDRTNGHRTWWRVRCDCGTEAVVRADSLTGGGSVRCTSCQAALSSQVHSTHGMSHGPEWRSWSAMRDRCEREGATGYSIYGGRGVRVCDRWASFELFFADMGPRPPGTTLDRIDPDGHYEPNNCRWATALEQNRNRRRTVFLEANGQRKALSDWAERLGVSHITLYKRYAAGWSHDAIVNTPKLPPTSARPRGHRHLRRSKVSEGGAC